MYETTAPEGHGGCDACRHAKWTMTRGVRPRVNRNEHGDCTAPVPDVQVPLAVSHGWNYMPLSKASRQAIWYGEEDGKGCPCWEAKPTTGNAGSTR